MMAVDEDKTDELALEGMSFEAVESRNAQKPLSTERRRDGEPPRAPLSRFIRNIPGFRNAQDGANSEALRSAYPHDHDVEPDAGSGGRRLLLRSFLVCVMLPSIVALIYYALLASDQFVSETKLTVKTGVSSSGNSSAISDVAGSFMGKIGLGGGSNGTSQDSRIILDYIKSRSIIEDIGGREKLAEYYDRPDIDWFSRLDSDAFAEEVWEYWKAKTTASVDSLSNIVTIRVKAYTPDDALALARQLVASSEVLINDISRRSREDALRRARDEVSRSMSELADARLAVLSFQQATQTIDPVQSAKQITTLISRLTIQKIELEGQLAVGDSAGVKGRPGDKYLQARLDVVNTQLRDLEKMLTGKDAASVSVQLKDFELLKLRQEFAERIYTLSRASFEEARRNLASQQFYLVVVVPPLKPERAAYPIVAADVGVVFLSCFVLWAIGALLTASIRDSNTL